MQKLYIYRLCSKIVFFISILALSDHNSVYAQMFQGSTVNTSATSPTASQNEPYGLNSPTDIYSIGNPPQQQTNIRITGESPSTRHSRWGNSTGIGDSFIQTSSPTSESRSPVATYRSYNISPAKLPASSFAGAQSTPSFSQSMTSPALGPTISQTGYESKPTLGADIGKLPALTTPSSSSITNFSDGFTKPNQNRFGNIGF